MSPTPAPNTQNDSSRDTPTQVPAVSSAATPQTPKPPEPPLAWGTRPAREGMLFPMVDGMCIHGEVLRYDNAKLFAYGMWKGPFSRGGKTTAQWIEDSGLVPQSNTGVGFLVPYGGAPIVAGRYPDQLMQITHNSTRMGSASFLVFGGSTQESRKIILDQGGDPRADTPQPTANAPTRDLSQPLHLRDGTWLVPETLQVVTKDKGIEPRYGFRKLAAEGSLVANAKVPGPDIAEAVARLSVDYTQRYNDGRTSFAELANGEIVALGATKLLRWSPTKPVDDVSAAPPGPFARDLKQGDKRVYFSVEGTLQSYDGTTVATPKLVERITQGNRIEWYADKSDTLYAMVPGPAGATLWTETLTGEVKSEPVPGMGQLFGLQHGGIWLRVVGKRTASGMGDSDTLYRKTGTTWEAVPIPAPPFGNSLRGPLQVENVQVFAPDDVFVNVRRIEKGWGWKDPEPYRAIYRTKRPSEVLRCQDVRSEQVGAGLWPWPPAADDSCKTPFVVVSMESEPLPKSYPGIAANMRGKTEFGDTVTLVNFQGRGNSNVGIVQTNVESARKLATLISKSQNFRADVVCGSPAATRELTLDTKTGTFSATK